MRFPNREAAGRLLAEALLAKLDREEIDAEHRGFVVLGLPRGGVPVAAPVAAALHAPLDVVCVRKLGLPGHPEFGLGAIGEQGVRVLDDDTVARFGVDRRSLDLVEVRERAELGRQVHQFRGGRPPLPVDGRIVILVDDGLATGGTARAAIQVLRARGARAVIVAVPVAPAETRAADLGADALFALSAPRDFGAVGNWYEDFAQTTDREVLDALANAARRSGPTRPEPARSVPVRIPTPTVALDGILDVPTPARGVVVFVHGSGSSRHSRRNQAVARSLADRGFATVLFDLLTEAEATDRQRVFDIGLLTDRLGAVVRWVGAHPALAGLPIGLFGASTGAAAALDAAAQPSSPVAAVVSRGGRPDLADALGDVRCPVLLVVGGADLPTLEANRAAAAQLRAPHELVVVPGATHLFEEAGALETVARHAASWFERFLVPAPTRASP
jgi:putative phosphoribosyl transferase